MTPLSPNQMAQARVLVVGDVMIDRYWYGSVDRISPEAPVPVVRVTRVEDRLGASANVALNVVHLGAQASLLSVVGQDEAGQQLDALLSKSGIQAELGHDAQLGQPLRLDLEAHDDDRTPTGAVPVCCALLCSFCCVLL